MNQNITNPRGEGGKTATEVTTVQRNADARFEQERQRVLQWWLTGVQKVSALVLRYGDRIAIEILGPQRGQEWVQADKGMFTRFSFEIVIDSGTYVDIESESARHAAVQPDGERSVAQSLDAAGTIATDFGIDPARGSIPSHRKTSPTRRPCRSTSSRKTSIRRCRVTSAPTRFSPPAGIKGLPPPQPVAVQPPAPVPNQPDHAGMPSQLPRLDQHQLDQTGQPPGQRPM